MRVNGIAYRTVWMDRGAVKLIDQRRLPFQFTVLTLRTCRETAEAIRDMTVRGAGAIGVAAGYAMAQAAQQAPAGSFDRTMADAAALLRATRPTARNLFSSIERILAGVPRNAPVAARRARAAVIAQAIADEDAACGRRIGVHGQRLFRRGPTRVMTHCNAGWLAFADWGSALAPIYEARRRGRRVSVWVNETRPRGQGARLTAWELGQEGVPYTLLPDTAAGHAMRQGLVDFVIVGADRIAANGDVANKIGTYALAVLAYAHRIPFYVAAPTTTIDPACPTGAAIPIEERSPEEVLQVSGPAGNGRIMRIRVAAAGAQARNWAFDVTPAALITGLLTERGLTVPGPGAIQALLRPARQRRPPGRRVPVHA